jgi:putative glycosyltransferase
MKLSIVSSLYNSAEYVEEFIERCQKVAQQLVGHDFEIVLVDDGSPDNSLQIAIELCKTNKNLRVIELSRNFGHHQAMTAGLAESTGQYVFLIDSDLEEEPEWLIDFHEKMKSEDADVIFGQQKRRKGTIFEKFTGWCWYKLYNFIANINHNENITTARLMKRKFVNSFLLFPEQERVISCLWILTGFRQLPHLVNKRSKGKTSYTFFKKISHCINSITSFSVMPLYFIFILGMLISMVSMCHVLFLLASKLLYNNSLEGWSSIMASIWLLGGLLISFVGVIGIYIAKSFIEQKKRPLYIIKEKYQNG